MANTYTQLNVHAIFAVKGRENLLATNFRTNVFEYIAGILRNKNQYPLAVNGHKDHVHIFFELNPSASVADVMEMVKANSSKWINENHFVKGKFEWQRGYGCFTYSRSQRDSVIRYLMDQENHHKSITFREEYLELLNKNEIQYDERYLFEFYE